MPVRSAITEPDGVYFITVTCARWVPLFRLLNGYDIVYKWFDYIKQSGHYIVGYVVMPDHLHAVIAFSNTGKLINSIVGNGKRFMAYEIVRRLQAQKKAELLLQLQAYVNATEANRNKLHEVFEPSFDWKRCDGDKFLLQKLNYIHWNPCKVSPQLSVLPEEYIHGSAKFYITGEQGIYPVTSYTELQDVDLTAGP
jgi:REP element-mobilizing transposase RayT